RSRQCARAGRRRRPAAAESPPGRFPRRHLSARRDLLPLAATDHVAVFWQPARAAPYTVRSAPLRRRLHRLILRAVYVRRNPGAAAQARRHGGGACAPHARLPFSDGGTKADARVVANGGARYRLLRPAALARLSEL